MLLGTGIIEFVLSVLLELFSETIDAFLLVMNAVSMIQQDNALLVIKDMNSFKVDAR